MPPSMRVASPDVTAERFLVVLGSLPLPSQLLLGPPGFGLEDDEATPPPLHALPRAGFGSEVVWESSTALSQPDADALESAVQAAVAQCASAGGASSLSLSISVAKTGETTIIPTPADTRGSCFASALGTLRLPPREAVASANILVDELHLAHLPASALKKPTAPKKPLHPAAPKPPAKPPRKKPNPGAPCVQCQ
jgi:hypothetical protein